jgi:hypothetical protein
LDFANCDPVANHVPFAITLGPWDGDVVILDGRRTAEAQWQVLIHQVDKPEDSLLRKFLLFGIVPHRFDAMAAEALTKVRSGRGEGPTNGRLGHLYAMNTLFMRSATDHSRNAPEQTYSKEQSLDILHRRRHEQVQVAEQVLKIPSTFLGNLLVGLNHHMLRLNRAVLDCQVIQTAEENDQLPLTASAIASINIPTDGIEFIQWQKREEFGKGNRWLGFGTLD